MTILCGLRLCGPRSARVSAVLALLPLVLAAPRAFSGELQEQLVLRGHKETIRALLFSTDGRRLYSAGADGAVNEWDLSNGKLMQTLLVKGLSAAALAPDGKTLVTGDKEGVVRVWNPTTLATAKELRSFTGKKAAIRCLAFHPAGELLASANSVGEAILWDFATGAEKARVPVGHDGKGAAFAIAFAPNGKSLSVGTYDEAVLWNEPTRKNVASFENVCSAQAVGFASDGKTLAVGTVVGGIQLWDLATKKKIAILGEEKYDTVHCVAFSADGKLLASIAEKSGAKLWDVAGRKDCAVFKKGEKVATVAFTPDVQQVVTGSRDGIVKVWKLAK